MEISREYGGEDQQFLFLIQGSFLTQHVLEPTRGENVLDIVLSLCPLLTSFIAVFIFVLSSSFMFGLRKLIQ